MNQFIIRNYQIINLTIKFRVLINFYIFRLYFNLFPFQHLYNLHFNYKNKQLNLSTINFTKCRNNFCLKFISEVDFQTSFFLSLLYLFKYICRLFLFNNVLQFILFVLFLNNPLYKIS